MVFVDHSGRMYLMATDRQQGPEDYGLVNVSRLAVLVADLTWLHSNQSQSWIHLHGPIREQVTSPDRVLQLHTMIQHYT